MEDRQLIELIRRGVSGWLGPSPRASSARYRNARQWTMWRSLATLSAAAGALLVIAATLAGGPGPALHDIGVTTIGSIELVPASSPSPTPRGDQATSRETPAPLPGTKSEPTPARSEPAAPTAQATPTGDHQPGATPTPTSNPPKK